MRKKILTTAAVLLTSLMFLGSANAGPATDSVQAKQTELFALVSKPKTPQQQEQLRKLFDEMLDYDSFAKGSMGRKWDGLSADQQAKFSGLLTKLVRNNYRRNLKKMLDYDISYAGEKDAGGGTLVMSRAKHKRDSREPVIEIDFRIKKVGDKLKVVDIVTERASLVKTYRSQFLRIMRKKGFDALIAKMEKKLAKLEKK